MKTRLRTEQRALLLPQLEKYIRTRLRTKPVSKKERRKKSTPPPRTHCTSPRPPLTMRLPSLLLLAASTALASSSSSDTPSEASPSPSPDDPIPAGQTWLAKWTDASLAPYTKSCAAKSRFRAHIYSLGEMYPALKEWAPQLKVFYNKQHYPGTWAGEDPHGTGRELLMMAGEDLPFKVREWYVGPNISFCLRLVPFFFFVLFLSCSFFLGGGEDVSRSSQLALRIFRTFSFTFTFFFLSGIDLDLVLGVWRGVHIIA